MCEDRNPILELDKKWYMNMFSFKQPAVPNNQSIPNKHKVLAFGCNDMPGGGQRLELWSLTIYLGEGVV